MKPLAAAVLLLVALVGAGCGSSAIEDTEGASIGGGVWTESMTTESLAEKLKKVIAGEGIYTSVKEDPLTLYYSNPCVYGVHDWQPLGLVKLDFYKGNCEKQLVAVEACSRCGILRVRP